MNKFKELLKTKLEYFLLGTFSFIAGLFIFPNVFTKNDLTSWDFVGHIFTAEFYKDNLYPNLMGWNPFHSLGYPQGTFYPSLIHFLIGFLDLIYNNTEFWIKLLFAVGLFSLPFCIYFFIKNLKRKFTKDFTEKDKLALVVIAEISTLIILFAPQLYGGSVRSFLQVGLLSNFLTLPVLFYYLGLIVNLDYSNLINRKNFLASLLLSFLLLSHLVNGPIALIFTLGMWILGTWELKEVFLKRILSSYFVVLVISFCSTAFFFLPYLQKSYLISPIENNIQFSKIVVLFFFTIFILSFLFLKLSKLESKKLFILFNGIIVLLVSISVFEIILNLLKKDFALGVAQPYRIFSTAIFLGIPFLLLNKWIFISQSKLNFIKVLNSERILRLIQIPVILVLIFGLWKIDIGTKDYGHLDYNKANVFAMKGNALSLVTLDDTYYLYRDPIYDPIEFNKDLFFVNTQFNESSYINAFTSALRDNIYETGKPSRTVKREYPETYQLSQNKVYFLLNLLNIKYLIFSDINNVKFNLCQNYFDYATIQPSGKKLYACQSYITPERTDSFRTSSYVDWNKNIYDFAASEENYNLTEDLGTGDRLEAMPIFAYKGEIKWSKNYQSFTINNDDLTDLTVVPIQYNPRWHAYKVDDKGNETEIYVYRVAPNLLGILNTGEKIVFRYEFSLGDRVLKYIAYLTILINLLAVVFWKLFETSVPQNTKKKINKSIKNYSKKKRRSDN